jgi:uncharacterized protein YdeI (YjbR/CyaY-like superfamily)
LSRASSFKEHAAIGFWKGSPVHTRQYIEWITEAKTAETRGRRVKTAIERMSEGEARNWKYRRA